MDCNWLLTSAGSNAGSNILPPDATKAVFYNLTKSRTAQSFIMPDDGWAFCFISTVSYNAWIKLNGKVIGTCIAVNSGSGMSYSPSFIVKKGDTITIDSDNANYITNVQGVSIGLYDYICFMPFRK